MTNGKLSLGPWSLQRRDAVGLQHFSTGSPFLSFFSGLSCVKVKGYAYCLLPDMEIIRVQGRKNRKSQNSLVGVYSNLGLWEYRSTHVLGPQVDGPITVGARRRTPNPTFARRPLWIFNQKFYAWTCLSMAAGFEWTVVESSKVLARVSLSQVMWRGWTGWKSEHTKSASGWRSDDTKVFFCCTTLTGPSCRSESGLQDRHASRRCVQVKKEFVAVKLSCFFLWE